MSVLINSVEGYEDPQTKVKFYYTFSSQEFTTGVMIIPPNTEPSKHARPKAQENLLQISGGLTLKIFKNDTNFEEVLLTPGMIYKIPIGVFHVHVNPNTTESITFFRADGDITPVVEQLRKTFKKLL